MRKLIMEPGLTVSYSGHISIDPNLWTTQALLAKKLKTKRNVLNNRVRRAMARGTITTYYIDQLGIRLIPNVNKINELGGIGKKQ